MPIHTLHLPAIPRKRLQQLVTNAYRILLRILRPTLVAV